MENEVEIEEISELNDSESNDDSVEDSSPVHVSSNIDEDNDFSLALLPDDVRRARRSALRPDIDWLDDAIDWSANTPSGVDFIPRKDQYVVIERQCISMPTIGWLDTRVYRLIEDPAPNGNLKLWDPIKQQMALSNWKTGIATHGFIFKLPPKGVNPETLLESSGKIRRRKRVAPAPPPPQRDENGNIVPKRRGRPPGTKNRSKEVILAEKAAKLKEQEQKRLYRLVK